MSAPLYVAMYGGFLVIETYGPPGGNRTKTYTVPNVRLATPFDTFAQADAAGKWAANYLYPPDVRYYAILQPPEWPKATAHPAPEAPRTYD